jgi:hypothetical protein
MTRFNKVTLQPKPQVNAIRSELKASALSALGGPGYLRDTMSELFLLGVTNFVGQETHHESAYGRDSRYATLIQKVALEDDGPKFLAEFFRWLRNKANIRTASYVGAAHLVAARKGMPDDGGFVRQAVANSLGRAEEPGELIAFWSATYGGQLPRPLKRGIAMAIVRLYTERSALAWDTETKAFRFARVLDLTHPTHEEIVEFANSRNRDADEATRAPLRTEYFIQQKRTLFNYLHARMRGRAIETPPDLKMIAAREALFAIPPSERFEYLHNHPTPATLMREAGMTWQAAASWYGRALDARFWAGMIPNMGVQGLLMNLRNFDKAGIAAGDVDLVCAILEDEVKVQRSKILPMQVLSAYRAVTSDHWGKALSRALDASLANVPAFDGKTLILVDTSTSMDNRLSADGELKRWDAAVIFAVALASRANDAKIASFSSMRKFFGDPRGAHTRRFELKPGESLLKAVERWKAEGYFLGGGTDTALALRKEFERGFMRVVIITDEQEGEDPVEVSESIPASVPMITLNMAGYRTGHAPSGTRNRIAIGGFNDAAFTLLAASDRYSKGRWPWETAPAA